MCVLVCVCGVRFPVRGELEAHGIQWEAHADNREAHDGWAS